MNRLLKFGCTALIGFGLLATPALSQDSSSKKDVSLEQIFSGTLTKFTDDSITVVRKTLGHAAVTREFSRDGETHVEGTLRDGARVTVRYRSGEEGVLVAVHVIVR